MKLNNNKRDSKKIIRPISSKLDHPRSHSFRLRSDTMKKLNRDCQTRVKHRIYDEENGRNFKSNLDSKFLSLFS